jgi:hypothetical protein
LVAREWAGAIGLAPDAHLSAMRPREDGAPGLWADLEISAIDGQMLI